MCCTNIVHPRRPRAEPGHHAGEEPLALPRRLPGGRLGDRLGDARRGVSFRHSVELLREDRPLAASSSRPVKVSTVPRLPRLLERDAEDEQLLRQVVRFYHETLKESPEALGYLAEARPPK